MRLYGDGLAIERAETTPQALAWFGRLVALHQSRWTGRGAPGAFADRRIRDFHAALIAVGLPRGEIDMLRISAGPREVGMLYQFRHGGRILSYQSGFTAEADARLKPGLVCHTLAIRRASAENAIAYDFMAGAQRYKTTLAAKGGQTMHWLTVYRPGSWAARWRGMKDRLRGRSAGAGGGTGSGDPSCEA
jgi:CelD/BcsL family acetyltransferase involved in cellulose biosynthesis